MKRGLVFLSVIFVLACSVSASAALASKPSVSVKDYFSEITGVIDRLWNNTLFGSKLLNRMVLFAIALVVLVVVVWAFVIVLALFRGFSILIDSAVKLFRWITSLLHKEKEGESLEDIEHRLDKLLQEKKEIEDMIETTKKKFHQRKLDEESFREIIRDHQGDLIVIETKIRGIEDRLNKLEKPDKPKKT